MDEQERGGEQDGLLRPADGTEKGQSYGYPDGHRGSGEAVITIPLAKRDNQYKGK